MLRKRRQPAPNFRMPGAPFNPATGERAPLGAYPGRGTTLALFQVIGDPPHAAEDADTHDNYVVCRGYEVDHDPNFRYLHDPYTKEDTTPIHVAKPYSVRGTFPYKLGQVIVAARILHRLGHNVGKADVTVGQPEDLDEEVVLLLDDGGVGIAWLDISPPPPTVGGVSYRQGGVTNVTGVDTTVTNYVSEHGLTTQLGWTIDLVTGIASYSRSTRTFLHSVSANVNVNGFPSGILSTLYGELKALRDPTEGTIGRGKFYWPTRTITFGTDDDVQVSYQSVMFQAVAEAASGDTFQVAASRFSGADGFDAFDVTWSILPLD